MSIFVILSLVKFDVDNQKFLKCDTLVSAKNSATLSQFYLQVMFSRFDDKWLGQKPN